MALVVYDQGYRIQTPVSALFKPKGVDALTELARPHNLPSSDDIERDEAEQLERQFRQSGSAAGRLPSARGRGSSSPTYERKPYAGTERRKNGLTAQQLMVSPVYTIPETASLRSGWQLMQEHNIHHLVVVTPDNRIQGLLSDTDFVNHGTDSPVSVAQAYQRQVIAAALDTELSVLATTFVNYPVRALPVIDADEKLAGIITRSDLLRLLINNARVENWA